jgi:hypothetical protein
MAATSETMSIPLRSPQTVLASLAQATLGLVFLLVPLQSLWLLWLPSHGVTGKPFLLLSFWYEPLLYVVFIGALLLRPYQLTRTDILALTLFGLALISWFWARHSLGDQILGMRYDMLPVLAWVCARTSGQTAGWGYGRLRAVAPVVLGSVVLQAIVWCIDLHWSSLVSLHLDPGQHYAGRLPQLFAPLPGPNQLASYALLVAIIAWYEWRSKPLAILSSVVLVATASRSALLGLLAALVTEARRNRIALRAVIAVGVLVLVLGVTSLVSPSVRFFVAHGKSQQGHDQALTLALDKTFQAPLGNILFGHGVGTSGPATLVRGTQFIPESWYLQVLYELGVAGLLLFLWWYIQAARQSHKPALIQAAWALGVNALFLHVFADNPAVTLALFALLGLSANTPLLG